MILARVTTDPKTANQTKTASVITKDAIAYASIKNESEYGVTKVVILHNPTIQEEEKVIKDLSPKQKAKVNELVEKEFSAEHIATETKIDLDRVVAYLEQ